MLTNIKKYFNNYIKANFDDSSDTVDHRLKIATAALLLEMVRADFEVKDKELDAVAQVLANNFGLDNEETHKLIELADAQAQQATCYYEFTRLIN